MSESSTDLESGLTLPEQTVPETDDEIGVFASLAPWHGADKNDNESSEPCHNEEANFRFRSKHNQDVIEIAHNHQEPPGFEDVVRFIIRFGTLAHESGSRAKRLEKHLSGLTARHGFRGTFRSFPDHLTFVFYQCAQDDLSTQRIHHISTKSCIKANRLAALNDLQLEMRRNEVSISEAMDRLNEIELLKRPWGLIWRALAYPCVAFGFGILLGSSWIDVGLGTAMSIPVFLIVEIDERMGPESLYARHDASRWLDVVCGFVTGLIATGAYTAIPQSSPVMSILGAILILIPGYTISLGVIEMATNHILSGFSNLITGIMCLVKLFTGSWLAYVLVDGIAQTQHPENVDPPLYPNNLWLLLGVPAAAMGFAVYYQTPYRDMFSSLVVSVSGYGVSYLGSFYISDNFGTLIGSVAMSLTADTLERLRNRPASVMAAAGILLLVSGSIGFRGLASIASGETDQGWEQFLQMFVVAGLILIGMIIAHTILPPRNSL